MMVVDTSALFAVALESRKAKPAVKRSNRQ